MKNFPFLVVVALLFNGCAKDELNEIDSSMPNEVQTKSVQNHPVEYYFDEMRVNPYDVSDTNIYVASSYKIVNRDTVVVFDGFSDVLGFTQFGVDRGLRFAELVEFEEYMKNYARTSGAIQFSELYDSIPAWYLDHERVKYEEIFKVAFPDSSAKTLVCHVYKEIWGTNGKTVAGTHSMYLGGWNNAISSFRQAGIYGFISLYDRTFYRNKLITHWGWGSPLIRLGSPWPYGHANNKTSSSICHGSI